MAIDINFNLFVRSRREEKLLEKIMSTLQEDVELAKANNARLDQLNAYVEQLYVALKNQPLSAEVQAQIDELHAELQKTAGKVEDTFTENTPPAP